MTTGGRLDIVAKFLQSKQTVAPKRKNMVVGLRREKVRETKRWPRWSGCLETCGIVVVVIHA